MSFSEKNISFVQNDTKYQKFVHCFYGNFDILTKIKMLFFWDNFRSVSSNLMYDIPKFKLGFPLYDKKRMNKKY